MLASIPTGPSSSSERAFEALPAAGDAAPSTSQPDRLADAPIEFKMDWEPIAEEPEEPSAVQKFLFPDKEELPDDFEVGSAWGGQQECKHDSLGATG